MSPIKLIERGLQTSNWKDVADGYAGLTGIAIEPPKGAGGNYNLVELLEMALARATDGNPPAPESLPDEPVEVVVKSKPSKTPKKTAKKTSNKEATSNSTTIFYGGEDMPASPEEKAWAAKVARPTRQSREAEVKVFVCQGCDKELPYNQIGLTRIGDKGGSGTELCVKCSKKKS